MSRSRRLGLVAVVLLAIAGLAGIWLQAVQQPANHPQVEMASAAVSRLDSGESPGAVIPTHRIDLGQSRDPYLIVVDPQRSVLASSASLGGQVVLPPPGVFDNVRAHGEERLTWAPATGLRSWIVVDTYRGGFVVAGRTATDGEQSAYLLIFWGALAALGLAGVAGLALLVTR